MTRPLNPQALADRRAFTLATIKAAYLQAHHRRITKAIAAIEAAGSKVA